MVEWESPDPVGLRFFTVADEDTLATVEVKLGTSILVHMNISNRTKNPQISNDSLLTMISFILSFTFVCNCFGFVTNVDSNIHASL